VSDVFSFDLADGLASGQCPLCYAVACDERRWLDSFWREGRQNPDARKRFYAGGGFCRRHAWLLHELVATDGSGAAIADIYGNLAEQDLATIDNVDGSSRDRRKPLHARLQRTAACSACSEEAEAVVRKAYFFLELIATEAGRRRYERSRGVCFTHLLSLLQAAGKDDTAVLYLLGDWRRRLTELRQRLADFDRKRDHRYADERRDDEQRSWTDIIHHYVGGPP
jgi:hypothetical protein